MGVNAQTSVPAFTAGQVLTAAEMTEVNTGIPVFATVVTRDAAFGGAGEKVLAQGQYAYIEATSTLQVYTGSAWATAGAGLTLVKSVTIGSAVSTIDVTDCFSATYDQYLISYTTTASAGSEIRFQFLTSGASVISTGYYYAGYYYQYGGGSLNPTASNNGANFKMSATSAAGRSTGQLSIMNPFLTELKFFVNNFADTGNPYVLSGYSSNTTSIPSFRVTIGTGTVTGGYIKVYGYNL